MNYTIKRLTNHPPAANTDTNKQLRVEVVSLLITYIQREYIRVSIDEIHFQVDLIVFMVMFHVERRV